MQVRKRQTPDSVRQRNRGVCQGKKRPGKRVACLNNYVIADRHNFSASCFRAFRAITHETWETYSQWRFFLCVYPCSKDRGPGANDPMHDGEPTPMATASVGVEETNESLGEEEEPGYMSKEEKPTQTHCRIEATPFNVIADRRNFDAP